MMHPPYTSSPRCLPTSPFGTLLGVFFAWACGMAATLTASPALESEGSFVAEVRQLVADDRFSGVVLGASGPDAEPWVVYGGMADVAEGRPIARDSVFGIASMTKMFTAVAIGQWVAAGRADWDDPVGRFLPELTAEWSGTITIRHLLTHTSGLGDYLDDPAYLARRGTLRRAHGRAATSAKS